MKDLQTVGKFIELRAQGIAFAQIAAQLNVGKRTLIRWSRQYQFEIQNLRAIETEAIRFAESSHTLPAEEANRAAHILQWQA